jgi:flagellar biosynthesis GTPase FlhF
MARMKKTTRVAFDAVLSVMLVFEMFIQYTGDFLHEVVGFAFFATIVAHLLFSRTWMASTAKAARAGKLPARRRFKAIIGIALGISMLLLGASSVAISQILASLGFSMAGSYLVWKALHTVSSYTLCILVVVHLCSHWASLASTLRIEYDPARRQAIGFGVKGVATLGAVALGISGAQSLSTQQAVAQSLAEATDQKRTLEQEATKQNPTAEDRPYRDDSPVVQERNKQKEQTRKHKRKRAAEEDAATATDAQDQQDQTAEQLEEPLAQDYAGDQGESSWYEEESPAESSADGICTLCHKYCPLSAPKCDKPYDYGLI